MDVKQEVYFFNHEWKQYVFYKEDELGYKYGEPGYGDTVEAARADYEAKERASAYRKYA